MPEPCLCWPRGRVRGRLAQGRPRGGDSPGQAACRWAHQLALAMRTCQWHLQLVPCRSHAELMGVACWPGCCVRVPADPDNSRKQCTLAAGVDRLLAMNAGKAANDPHWHGRLPQAGQQHCTVRQCPKASRERTHWGQVTGQRQAPQVTFCPSSGSRRLDTAWP